MYYNIISLCFSYIVYQTPSIKELQSHRIIIDIGPQWYRLGIALLRADQLNNLEIIKSDHKEAIDCCTEMFIYWLKTHSNATWYQLAEALRSPGVELNSVAAKVEASFPGLLIMHEALIQFVITVILYIPYLSMPMINLIYN